jgi:purine-nucleoside phosphorylase
MSDQRLSHVPEIAIVCGSGLGGLVAGIKVQFTLKYEDIPHFPVSSVQGHDKALAFGELGGKKVVAMTGWFHFYEGFHPWKVAYGVRTLAALGAKILIVTNAAGGVNAKFEKNDIMLMEDHISFSLLER